MEIRVPALLHVVIDIIFGNTFRRRRYEVDIITATSEGEVFVWDYTKKKLSSKISIYPSSVSGLCFVLSDDRIVTASRDGDISVTDLSVLYSVSIVFVKTFICRYHFNIYIGRQNRKILFQNKTNWKTQSEIYFLAVKCSLSPKGAI